MRRKKLDGLLGYQLDSQSLITLTGGSGDGGGTTSGSGGSSGEPDPPPLPTVPDDTSSYRMSYPIPN